MAPSVLLAALGVLAISPLLLCGAAIVDVVRRGGWRTVRLLTVGVAYLAYQVVGILALLVLWLASGLGLWMRSPPLQAAHYAFMHWWLGSLFGLVMRLLGIRIEIEDRQPPRPGPVLVFSRHAGPGDSMLLVNTLMTGFRRRPRIVMKAELQWDPVVDVVANRLPNGFIRPDSVDRRRYVEAIASLADRLGDRDALVIFPEGGNFSEHRRLAAIARLVGAGRLQRAEQAERMRNLLPPRPGGVMAAMARAPDADVVFVAHTGLEELGSLVELWRGVPLRRPLLGRYWRFPVTEVPSDPEARIDWLYDWWGRIDAWIEERRARSSS